MYTVENRKVNPDLYRLQPRKSSSVLQSCNRLAEGRRLGIEVREDVEAVRGV